MSINNFSSRTMTENCAIEYDYPWMKWNGPVQYEGAISGSGLKSLVSYARYVYPPNAVAANTTVYANFTGGTFEVDKWKVPLLTLGPFTSQQNFKVNVSGLYFIHFMTTYSTDPSANQIYGTELAYYAQGTIPGTVVSSAMIDRGPNSFTALANSKSYFRYLEAGDEFTVRFRNSENNTCNLRMNICYFAL